jgi:hypothetical protein
LRQDQDTGPRDETKRRDSETGPRDGTQRDAHGPNDPRFDCGRQVVFQYHYGLWFIVMVCRGYEATRLRGCEAARLRDCEAAMSRAHLVNSSTVCQMQRGHGQTDMEWSTTEKGDRRPTS